MIAEDLTLIHHINGVAFDVSHLVESVKLSGRMGGSSRTLTASFVDDTTTAFQNASHVKIELMEGDFCILRYGGNELFRGMWFKTSRSDKQKMTATAYDCGVYLANNKDTFVYNNMTLASIFQDVCTRFGLPIGEVAGAGHVISELVKSRTTAWDVIEEAMEMTYEATGVRYAVVAREGKVHLLERRENLTQWVLEGGVNLTGYSRTISIDKVRTRIKIYGKEDTVLVEVKNGELESKIGIMQDVDTAKDDEMSQAQINAMANTLLKESSVPDTAMTVSGLGIPDVISGTGVYVKINELDNFERACYVQEDTHSWDNKGNYKMTLKVIPIDDVTDPSSEPTPSQTVQSDISEGSIVNFTGGPHYVSSTSSGSGTYKSAGQARLTKVAKGASHPYHLVGGAYDPSVPGDCTVYGWVDASTIG